MWKLQIFLTLAICHSVFGIMGGGDTTIEKHPYMARIFHNNEFICSGVIISSKFILTSDTCLTGIPTSTIQVKVGSTKLNEGTTVHAKDVFRASTADWKQHMAVISLSQDLKLNSQVKSIKLADTGDSFPKKLKTLGWGVTKITTQGHVPIFGPNSNTLQEVELDIYDREDCRDKMEYTGKYLYGKTEGCAGRIEEEKGLCRGDLGAPLIKDNVVYGIFNWIPGMCAKTKYPQVYSSVPYFHDWINKQMQQ